MSDAKQPETSQPRIKRHGVLLVLSSPSGAGKTTLAKRLRAFDPTIEVSVSVTTRPMRPGEVEGRDYYFLTEAEFMRRRDAGELLEWAKVHGNFYATPKAPIDAHIAAGRDVLFDIDWQGAQQLAAKATVAVTRVFVLPPSTEVLRRRLETRAQDSAEVVEKRLAAAGAEITHWPEYDYVIVNSELEASVAGLIAVLTAERLKRARQIGLPDFVAGLVARG